MSDCEKYEPAQSVASAHGGVERVPFRKQVCQGFLLEAQNADGGWGYQPTKRSAVEPTAWALLALDDLTDSPTGERAIRRGVHWLRASQHPDGSWPAFPGQSEGSWITALACLALREHLEAQHALRKGLEWLCDTWPAEGKLWHRLRQRLLARSSPVRQKLHLRGWSWTPGTSSWVEPTACAVILLRSAPPGALPPQARKRLRLAEGMLFDRICPDGGWNSGNPVVYGAAGQPLIGPTAWALLALQNHQEHTEVQKSLDWLARTYVHSRGPASLCLAHICLRTYHRPVPGLECTLSRLYEENCFLESIPITALAAVALGRCYDWALPHRREATKP